MKKFITLLLVLTGCVMTATAAVDFLGHSAIYVNGVWYGTDSDTEWCGGGKFHGKDLGTITMLVIGGQSQTYENNGSGGGINWKSGTVTMYYKIDSGAANSINLNYWKFQGNNNYFQSGGGTWSTETIDISGLSTGSHTLQVWFNCGDKWDNNNNNSNNYQATFTIPTTQTVNIPASGKGTYSSAFNLDFSSTSKVSAYTVSALSSTSATLTKLTQKVPAGTGLIVMGSGSEDISVVNSSDPIGTNYLHATGTSGTTVGADYAYILSSGQFHPANAGTIPANKAYLLATDIPSPSGSRPLNLVYEETTGINATQISNDLLSGDYYNLAGQRVTKPSKGLYIVNGKKVIIK